MPSADQLTEVMKSILGEPVRIREVELLGPWAVARVHLEPVGDSVPSSVIVKWLRQNSVGFRTDPAQLVTEREALRFIETLQLDVAPRVLGHDAGFGVVVLEDLAPAVVLWDVLGGEDDLGHRGLVAFARALGQLHAATFGLDQQFYERMSAAGVADPERDRRRIAGAGWAWNLPDLSDIGVEASDGAEADMALVRDLLLEPGPFLALSNGDAGANNVMIDDGEVRIIDWEMAGFRHALIDAACLYVPGPMWMTIEQPAAEVEDAYRQALTTGVDAANDEAAFSLALGAACLATAIERSERLPMLDQRPAGHHSRIQMIATLEAAVRVALQRSALPELSGWMSDLAAHLRRRWPDADQELTDAYTRRE